MRQINKIRQVVRNLEAATSKMKLLRTRSDGFTANITFDYSEQELIRRVFKAVFSQFRSAEDKSSAQSILEKTERIDG